MATPSTEMLNLAKQLELTAEWRDEKAAQYPMDDRNGPAAKLLRDLATSCVDTIPGPDNPAVALWSSQSPEWEFDDVQVTNDYITGIGFHYWPSNAEELCAGLLASITEEEAA